MANVIAGTGRPALVLAPNKTLAAQLYGEFKELFPDNAVEYFVSYYDYYQPEAYLPTTDTFIEKDSAINDEIDKMRHSATRSLLTRRDVIIVASVSCIYGIGSPGEYQAMHIFFRQGEEYGRDTLLRKLVEIQYERNDTRLPPRHASGCGAMWSRSSRPMTMKRRCGSSSSATTVESDQRDRPAAGRCPQPADEMRHLSGLALRVDPRDPGAGGGGDPGRPGGADPAGSGSKTCWWRRSASSSGPSSTSR